MTMSMTSLYNQPSNNLQRSSRLGYNLQPSEAYINANSETLHPVQTNIPPRNLNRSLSPKFQPYHASNRGYPMSNLNRNNNVQYVKAIPQAVPIQNDSHFKSQPYQGRHQGFDRQNNFVRQSQIYPAYVPTGSYLNSPQYFQSQLHYQLPNVNQYQNYYRGQPAAFQPYYQPYPQPYPNQHTQYIQKTYPQPYPNQHTQYIQQIPYNYIPLYTSPYQLSNNILHNQYHNNIPEQSINSNFNYEQANFDCNYSVEENLVHCVLCNQTYKISQKKQHLQRHRQKVKNVNIRPVDQQQLKRLQKYNSMLKNDLIIKPIVEPDQFNVQYNPNEFVLRKVTQYKDIFSPVNQSIGIQAEQNSLSFVNPQDIGYNTSFRSNQRDSSLRVSQPSESASRRSQNNRLTNTRFNNDSVRQQQNIFFEDKFHVNEEGEQLKSNQSINSNKKNRENIPEYEQQNSSKKAEDLGYISSGWRLNLIQQEQQIQIPKKLNYHQQIINQINKLNQS